MKPIPTITIAAIVASFFSLVTTPTQAQIIEYTSYATFSAAIAGPITTDNYDGILPESDSSGAVVVLGPTSIGTVTVNAGTTSDTVTYVFGSAAGAPGDGSSALVPYQGSESFTLPTGTANGMGLTVWSVQVDPENAEGTVTASNGDTYNFLFTAPVADRTPSSVAFIGFTDSDPTASIDSITFTPYAGNLGFGDVSFGGSVAAAPEPSTYSMVLGALGALFLIMKRRKSVA